MDITGYTEVPDEITNKAYQALKFKKTTSFRDKMIISQYKYSQKHGDFKLHTEQNDTHLICTLEVNGESHTCRIPLKRYIVTDEIYPIGDVNFKNIQLLSVSFEHGAGWSNETFRVHYWAEPIDEKNELDSFFTDNFRILTQYYCPRGLIEDPGIDEIVDCTNDCNEQNFSVRDIRNFTRAAMPNPWAQYSIAVLYENKELANKVFNHDELHLAKEKYHCTPPCETPNFKLD